MARSGNRKTQSKAKPRGNKPNNTRPHGRAVPGIHSVKEVFEVRPHKVLELWVKDSFENKEIQGVIEKAKYSEVKLKKVKSQDLSQICETHQGIVAFVDETPELIWEDIKKDDPAIYLCLDEIQDPHNLGAILRTSWLLGVKGIFVANQKSNLLTPSACKVACGGAEHVPVDFHSSLPNLLKELQKHNFWVYGLDMGGKHDLWSSELQLPEKIVWVIGNEGKGIRKPIKNICDEIVHIEQTNRGASFNASVATAIALGETVRRHRQDS